MHPLFRVTEHLPVPVGQSPFHFRGFYYDRLILRIQKSAGGMERLRQEVAEESVYAFLKQRFQWNHWYDALPTVPIYAALARMQGTEFEQTVRDGARQAAIDLVPRMFRFGLGLLGSGALAARVTDIMMRSVDFGRVRLERLEVGHGTGFVSGIPLILAPSVANVFVGWAEGMLVAGGATDVTGGYSDVSPEGKNGDYETVTIRFEFTWNETKDRE